MKEIYKVYDNIYRAIIPLRGNPLKSINIFIIKDGDRAIVVDTGFNTKEVIEYTENYIKELGLDLTKTILFITHLHSDHSGLAGYFKNRGARVYMPEVDAVLMGDMRKHNGKYWDRIKNFSHIQGLGVDNLDINDHPGYKFRTREAFEYEPVKPGQHIKIGDYDFEVIDLYGHTPGMCGLYEKKHSILFGGDHILHKITSNIQFWGFEFGDALGKYLDNLKKVKDLNIKHLYSSHRDLISDVNKRCDEMFEHHRRRLDEAYHALDNGALTPRDVAVRMSWDIDARDWKDFPDSQKWFAVGEAHSHLEHLRYLGKIDYIDKNKDGVLYYFQK
jgi:glyoxylase-like metal-dependent hydrolase (beta-lactamase superfamily II)